MSHARRTSPAFVIAVTLLAFAASAKDWDVRARGRLVYPEGGVNKPIPGATVEVRDSDTLLDDTLGRGHTDANGYFNVAGRGGDPGLPFGICDDNCTKPDTYVTVSLRNDRVDVETELGFTWHVNTGVKNNTAGDMDFGSFRFGSTDGQHAEILYARTIQQYDNYQRLVGGRIPRHDGKVNILFPAVLAAGVPWTTEESIHWPGGEDRWNAVFHEFGHRIRHAADGDFAHFLYDVARFTYAQQHQFEKKTNQGFAFNEGWAEYHSTLLDSGTRSTFTRWAQIAGGDEVEGNVAQKLTALSDKCGGFKNMWAALTSRSIHSYADFEAAMKAKYPGCFTPQVVARVSPLVLAAPRLHALALAPRTVDAQTATIHRVTALSPTLAAIHVKPRATVTTVAAHTGHAAVLQKLTATRTQAGQNALVAARSALQKHYAGLKPITFEMAKSGAYLQQRQAARHGFVQEALGAQVREIDKVLAHIRTERASPANLVLHKHLDWLKGRYERRSAELKQVIAQRPTPNMKIPLHLLPRGLGAEAQAAR